MNKNKHYLKSSGKLSFSILNLNLLNYLFSLISISLMRGIFFPPESYFVPFNDLLGSDNFDYGIPFGRYYFYFAIAWIFITLIFNYHLFFESLRYCKLPILFSLIITLSSFLSENFVISFNRSFRSVILIIVVAIIIEKYRENQLLKLIYHSGILLILACFIATVWLPQYSYVDLADYSRSWRGATMHKNVVGFESACVFVQSLAYYFSLKRADIRPLIVSFIAAFMVIYSQSVTSIIGVSIAFFITLFTMNVFTLRELSAKYMKFFLLIALFLILLLINSAIYSDIIVFFNRSTTLTGRTEIWENVIELIKMRPMLGYGNAFWAIPSIDRSIVWMAIGWPSPHSHNTFYDVILQTGFFGFACLMFMFLALIFAIPKMYVVSTNYSIKFLWICTGIFIIIRSFSETSFVDPGGYAWLWFIISYILVIRNRDN